MAPMRFMIADLAKFTAIPPQSAQISGVPIPARTSAAQNSIEQFAPGFMAVGSGLPFERRKRLHIRRSQCC